MKIKTHQLPFQLSSQTKTTSQQFNSDHSPKNKYNSHMLSCTPIPDKTRIHTRARIRNRRKRNRKGAKTSISKSLKILIFFVWTNIGLTECYTKTEIHSFFKPNSQLGISSNRLGTLKISLIPYSNAAIIGPKLFKNPKNISLNKHRKHVRSKIYRESTGKLQFQIHKRHVSGFQRLHSTKKEKLIFKGKEMAYRAFAR